MPANLSPVFTDLIDPFGDVDLVVPDRSDIEPLIRDIQSRIGIAPALRWEVRTSSQIDMAQHIGAATALDLVEIQIGPDRLNLQNTDAAEDNLHGRTLTGKLPERWRSRRDMRLLLEVSLFALRAARFRIQAGYLCFRQRLQGDSFFLPQDGPVVLMTPGRGRPLTTLASRPIVFPSPVATRRHPPRRHTVPWACAGCSPSGAAAQHQHHNRP